MFFLIFTPRFESRNERNSKVKKDLRLSVVILCQFQISMLYLVSGFAKTGSEIWTSGVAIYYTTVNPDYSVPFLYNNVGSIPDWFFVFLTYSTILYQITFPIFIHLKMTKTAWLIVGALLHLSISLVLGLWFFGVFMIISHSIFYDKKQSKKILSFITNNMRRLSLLILRKGMQ